ncbi:1D-myo-inositol 2-acetamido-2-deoxy-alpha-D-glucopyranoside deacetylase [Streptomyces sp. RB5]|uniref:1D-myo-inositol 2-acetamido-2-deoxy-alpha-D-glucopyranoside deacetylase n=1 Tax=Streptomyces smaragdinus TaxID=2585196 RepID=A0A7K0CMQ4_9ACTN|nr:PIG-L deacetylase family protein [Streptomyces smaragdinus]MQY14759.1 1D-myo-inositol 2-acetamido-2-deoxy-alpha-D-glucopyranoside deacetylase [Streptomyces smaragdinus]
MPGADAPAARRLRILAVGAHPDDIELGAGALVAKAVALGHTVSFLVLTDEDTHGRARRAECVRAARELGVTDVRFAGLRDGHLRADGDSVRAVRALLHHARLRPDIVVTHTQADSHNDHVEAHRVAHAVCRDTAFLHFSIHISAEPDRFSPRVFVALTPDRARRKDAALAHYPSQAERIGRLDLAKYEAGLGRLARLERAEGFETGVQYGTTDTLLKTLGLSDSAFHRLWQPVIADRTVTLLYGAAHRGDPRSVVHRNAAQDLLRQSFIDCWPPPYPLRESYANTDEALTLAATGSIVTTGGAATNQITARLLHAGALHWDVADGSLRDLRTGHRRASRHAGYIARVASPLCRDALAVAAAGVSPVAARTGVELLADPGRRPELAEVFDGELEAQVAFAVDPATGELELLDVTTGTAPLRGTRP